MYLFNTFTTKCVNRKDISLLQKHYIWSWYYYFQARYSRELKEIEIKNLVEKAKSKWEVNILQKIFCYICIFCQNFSLSIQFLSFRLDLIRNVINTYNKLYKFNEYNELKNYFDEKFPSSSLCRNKLHGASNKFFFFLSAINCFHRLCNLHL